MASRLMPGFYTRTGSAQAGVAEKDFAVADGQGDYEPYRPECPTLNR
jgi:hypothetical protein